MEVLDRVHQKNRNAHLVRRIVSARVIRVCGLMSALAMIMGMLVLGFAQSPPAPPMRFREISRQAGLTTVPNFSPAKPYVIETTGGGIGLFDCDDDGKLDIVVSNDSTVDRYLHGGDPLVTLYHQDENLHFTDITRSAGLTTRGWGMGVAVGDFDNDGRLDFYVPGYGRNALYRNRGGCKFEDVTDRSGTAGGRFSIAAAWADYDRDGNLDLFVSRYITYDIHNLPGPGSPRFNYKGIQIEPPTMSGETHLLYHNRGDGTFEEVSEKAGVHNPEKHRGMGAVWGDYDDDGWPDLYVTNDLSANFLYHNNHDGTFEDVGLVSGTALNFDGQALGDMAGDFGDFDRDGSLDLVVTRWGRQYMSLYWNQKDLGFTDIAWEAKIAGPSFSPVKWGTGFVDFDNDGWPDIFVSNGNVSPMMDTLPNEDKFREPLILFHNKRDRTFENVANIAGLNDGPLESRRGAAFGDVNNDGNVDVALYNLSGPPSLFINETRNSNHRALFRLIATRGNRAAIGTRVIVYTSAMKEIDEVHGGDSYSSSNDLRLHFGLGADAVMKKVEIWWPSGLKEELQNVPGDVIYEIVEGKGIKKTVKLPPPGSAPEGPVAGGTEAPGH